MATTGAENLLSLFQSILNTPNRQVREVLSRSLGNYLYLRANFGTKRASEIDEDDIQKILGRFVQDLKMVVPSELGQGTREEPKQNGRSIEEDIRHEVQFARR